MIPHQLLGKEIKTLKKALKNDHLYTDQELIYLKRSLKLFESMKKLRQYEQKSMYGFGNFAEEIDKYGKEISKLSISDAESGTDDGVHSESEQSVESGESECSGTTEVLHQA